MLRKSKWKGKVPEGDNIKYAIILTTNEINELI